MDGWMDDGATRQGQQHPPTLPPTHLLLLPSPAPALVFPFPASIPARRSLKLKSSSLPQHQQPKLHQQQQQQLQLRACSVLSASASPSSSNQNHLVSRPCSPLCNPLCIPPIRVHGKAEKSTSPSIRSSAEKHAFSVLPFLARLLSHSPAALSRSLSLLPLLVSCLSLPLSRCFPSPRARSTHSTRPPARRQNAPHNGSRHTDPHPPL